MRLIALTNSDNQVKVDDDDYAWLSKFKWLETPKGYALCTSTKIIHRRMHRAIMMHHGLLVPGMEPNHKDLDKLNNQKYNLKNATRSTNMQHAQAGHGKGVTYHNGKWRARITKDYKQLFLGYFDTREEAEQAYRKAAHVFYEE